jgi:peptidoglycan/xylan/chitin deacetylase (PgdA/CDA1 family)
MVGRRTNGEMTLKGRVENILGAFGDGPLLRRWIRRRAQRSVNVVYYHFVGRPSPHYKTFYSGCSISKFSKDLRRLNRIFDFATLERVAGTTAHSDDGARPTIAITFDDGLDLKECGAMEVLDDYGIKATTFVITSCIDNRRMMWRHMLSAIEALAPEAVWQAQYTKLAQEVGSASLGSRPNLMDATKKWKMNRKDEWAAELWQRCGLLPVEAYLAENRPYMGWKGLRQWLSAGHSVGFHTHTHPDCSRLTRDDLEEELIRPAAQLKQDLGISELPISYPFGHRLPREFEHELVEKRVFNSCFGIGGFSKKGTPAESLERTGVESSDVSWSVLKAILKQACCVKPIQTSPVRDNSGGPLQ